MRKFSYVTIALMSGLTALTLFVAVSAGCGITGDLAKAKSGSATASTAWKSEADPLFGFDVVFEFVNDRNLTAAHLSLDEASLQEGGYGGFGSPPQPPDVGAPLDETQGGLEGE